MSRESALSCPIHVAMSVVFPANSVAVFAFWRFVWLFDNLMCVAGLWCFVMFWHHVLCAFVCFGDVSVCFVGCLLF